MAVRLARMLIRGCHYYLEIAAAVEIWEAVPPDGELATVHRRELERLAEICKDRIQFFSVKPERRDYRQRKLD